jgi:hypothetical protein
VLRGGCGLRLSVVRHRRGAWTSRALAIRASEGRAVRAGLRTSVRAPVSPRVCVQAFAGRAVGRHLRCRIAGRDPNPPGKRQVGEPRPEYPAQRGRP